MRATQISLITLITPVFALVLGHLLNGERLEPLLGLGTVLILSGLALHQAGSLQNRFGQGRKNLRSGPVL